MKRRKPTLTIRTRNDSMSLLIEKKSWLTIGVLFLITLVTIVAGAGLGNGFIPPAQVLTTVLGTGSGEHDFIIMTLRMPRVLVAVLVGAALGISGAILQSIIRNPLASPDVIGITGGAAVAAVGFVSLLSGQVSIKFMPLAATIGALLASFIIYVLAWRKGVTPIRLVLIGIGMSAVTGAGTTFMLVQSPHYSLGKAYTWLTGSVYGSTWDNVWLILWTAVILLPFTLFFARSLDAQQFGDDVASGLGVAVQRHRVFLVLISVLLAGIAVAVAGTVGFVGLIAPHIARKLVGRPFGSLVMVSAFIGGLLVLGADLIGRTAFYPLDVPAGVFTAGVGAPFFLYLLFKNRNQF
ncbi:FecCD family ABC transporter permease [Paenibacillus senegalensis]|uniref:FecCD family ABC transporter permease n=1 Tax=Paenibacillus senegalensis TaxID=1465766 RepID=UPI00028925B3|nr:iron ABC transporter permease [Paenibacillus senegalensis]